MLVLTTIGVSDPVLLFYQLKIQSAAHAAGLHKFCSVRHPQLDGNDTPTYGCHMPDPGLKTLHSWLLCSVPLLEHPQVLAQSGPVGSAHRSLGYIGCSANFHDSKIE